VVLGPERAQKSPALASVGVSSSRRASDVAPLGISSRSNRKGRHSMQEYDLYINPQRQRWASTSARGAGLPRFWPIPRTGYLMALRHKPKLATRTLLKRIEANGHTPFATWIELQTIIKHGQAAENAPRKTPRPLPDRGTSLWLGPFKQSIPSRLFGFGRQLSFPGEIASRAPSCAWTDVIRRAAGGAPPISAVSKRIR